MSGSFGLLRSVQGFAVDPEQDPIAVVQWGGNKGIDECLCYRVNKWWTKSAMLIYWKKTALLTDLIWAWNAMDADVVQPSVSRSRIPAFE